jgi:hypothetical protein
MPVRMKGNKLYRTVNERLTDAHGDDISPVGIQSIISDAIAVGPAVVVRSTVTFTGGRSFTGISLANFAATSGAEATNPIETAETSAVGRALAMAGYFGSDTGIAGAEEMKQAERIQASRQGLDAAKAAVAQAPKKDPLELYDALVARCLEAGYDQAKDGDLVAFTPDALPDVHIRPEYQRLQAWLKAKTAT